MLDEVIDNADILITGGTGSLGRALVAKLLQLPKPGPRRICIYSRDELKQSEMQREFSKRFADQGAEDRLRFFIGDVRDGGRLKTAFWAVDHVIHAAALKQVPSCEYNPQEAVKTNIGGAMELMLAALETGVSRVLAISTDKACNPVNLYGATKLAAERIFKAANNLAGGRPTIFSICRYGNVIGSRGSVIPLFREQMARGEPFTITSAEMTRFLITLPQAAQFVLDSLARMRGGEIFVPTLPAADINTIADAIGGKDYPRKVIGIRPGEKSHETLITDDEAVESFSPVGSDYFVIGKERLAEVPQDEPIVVYPVAYRSSAAVFRLSAEECRLLIGEQP